jgi:DNA helicase-2/ATP-dependent DNA helicase PcrA
LYEEYHRRLAAHNALDFNDLLIKTVKLFRDSPDTLALLQHKWRYLMIDEYQDTNRAQYLISKMLASGHRNLCVVGDDDQSIYSWRGADIRNILDFEKDYPDAKIVRLEYNYRSTRHILDAASAVIANNSERKGKDLVSFRGDGERPVWCQTNNEYGESEFAINTIMTIKKQEGYSNRDFAIFYRTNAQSRVFEDALRRENIPYRIVGGLKFYDRKEIKDILAYMRFIVNPYDSVAMMRVINTPARGIGARTLEKLRETAYMNQMSEWEAIDKQLPLDGKQPKGLNIFRSFILGALDEYARVPDSLKLADFVMHIIEKSGYRDFLASDKSVEGQSRLENVEEFLTSVYEYQERNPQANPEEFLQEVSLLTTEENPVKDTAGDPTNVVTMMTVHNAKGLEFPVVFLTGLEEDIFPHFNCRDNEQMIEEERRLCYVGITRAMDRLYMTSAELRRTYSGEVNYRTPSRFINEIPADLLISRNHQESFRSGSSFGDRSASPRGDRFFNNHPSFGKKPGACGENRAEPLLAFSVNSKFSNPSSGPAKLSLSRVRDDVV